MLTLSERVKEAVESAREKGHSVSDIAKACNIKVQAVYAWASGDSKSIDGNNLVELAELSGYRPMWIMKGKGQKFTYSSDPERIAAHVKIDQLEKDSLSLANKILTSIAEPAVKDTNPGNKK